MEDITLVQLFVELLACSFLGLVLACFTWLAFDSDEGEVQ